MRLRPQNHVVIGGISPAAQPDTTFGANISAEIPAIHALWNGLAMFPASGIDDALRHLMHWFQQHLDVDNVFWLGHLLMLEKTAVAEDPLLGWRLRARSTLLPDSKSYLKLLASYYSTEHYGRVTPAYLAGRQCRELNAHIGETSLNLVKGAGKFRAHRLRDGWVNYPKFRRTEHYRCYYANLGIADRIWVAYPINTHTESLFVLDRHRRQTGRARKNFTDRDTAVAATVLYGQRELHRRLLLSNGVLRGVKVLSPLKRRILQELLGSRSEKEIATFLGQRPSTLRKTVAELYAEFNVKTRPGLMALWLAEE